LVTGFDIDNQHIMRELSKNISYVNHNILCLIVAINKLTEALAQIGISKDNDYNDEDEPRQESETKT